MIDRLGDAPIESGYIELMNGVAEGLDTIFNGSERGHKRTTGFILLAFKFNDHEGRCNYISNARREDVVVLLREQLSRFEGMAEASGSA